MSAPIPPVSILIPTYNDRTILRDRFAEVYAVVSHAFPQFEILILDDASGDGSWELLQTIAKGKRGVRISRHEKNQGIGGTFGDLYMMAEYPYVVTFSFDSEWEVQDIPRLVRALDTHDLVVGQRHRKAYPVHRQLISWSHNILNKLLFGVDTYDAQSIKAVRRELLHAIPLTSTTVYYEAERIIRAIRMGYRVGTLPISHYGSDKLNRSGWRVKLVSGAFFDMIRLWVRLTFYEHPGFTYRHNR